MAQNLAEEIGKRTAFSIPEQEALLNVVRTAAVLDEPFDRLFRSHGISAPLYNILRIVQGVSAANGDRGVPSGDLGRQMLTPAPDVTRLVDRLAKLELATRQRCDEDRRVVYVRLTPKGRRLLKKINPLDDALHKRLLGSLKRSELRQINELMVKARQAARQEAT